MYLIPFYRRGNQDSKSERLSEDHRARWKDGSVSMMLSNTHTDTHTQITHTQIHTYTDTHRQYIQTQKNTHTHTHTCIHTYTSRHTEVHINTYTRIHKYIHADTRTDTYKETHTYTHTHAHTQINRYTEVHIHTCTHTCTHSTGKASLWWEEMGQATEWKEYNLGETRLSDGLAIRQLFGEENHFLSANEVKIHPGRLPVRNTCTSMYGELAQQLVTLCSQYFYFLCQEL